MANPANPPKAPNPPNPANQEKAPNPPNPANPPKAPNPVNPSNPPKAVSETPNPENPPKAVSVAPERQTVYVEALNKSIRIFTACDGRPADEVIADGLRSVADAAAVDRIVILRMMNKTKAQFGEIYRWRKREGGTAFLGDNLKALPENKLFVQWLSAANNDDCIKLNLNDVPQNELDFLGPFGIKSILLVPVFASGELWGVFTFQDHVNERDFDEDCTRLLRSTARLCVNTVIREEQNGVADKAAEAHKHRKLQAEAVHKTAVLFLSQIGKPFREMMTEGITPILNLVNIDRFSVFQNFTKADSLHSSQVYRWEKKAGGSTAPNKDFVNITFEKFAPMWEYLFAEGKSENGPVRLMPEQEAATLKSFGVVSAYVTPIFINKKFWGVALFEDHHNERYFDNDYVEMMHSLAFFCGNTIIRAEMDQKIRNAEILKKERDDNEKYKKMAFWYESLLNAMPFSILVQDMDENCTFMNEVAETALGKKRSEIVGKPCRNLGVAICGTDKCAVACAKRGRMRTHFLHGNIKFQADTKILKDMNGKTTGYIEVVQDVTEDA